MTAKITLDRAGRIVLPKPLRKELQLQPGDALELESHGDEIRLRPARGSTPLQKEDGIWVFRTGKRIPAAVTSNLVEEIRAERDRGNLGTRR